MHLRYHPYTLHFKHPFTIAHGSRATTDVVYVELEHEGVTGYGEAAMPPYVGESQQSVMTFLSQLRLAQFNNPLHVDAILDYCDAAVPGNHAAKAAVDIALHDLAGKLSGKPLFRWWNLQREELPPTCITIGMDNPETIAQKVQEAHTFPVYKVKLGGAHDKEIIRAIRACTSKPLMIDANQGWKDKNHALDMTHWLHEHNALLIEQPFPKTWRDETAWLRSKSPLPIIADEAVQRLADLDDIEGAYDGINIKLMKCTGLREARLMMERAKQSHLKILLGCMSESSCAVTAAAHLAHLADWTDLDGPLLITNDPFTGIAVTNGKIMLPELPGTGAAPNARYANFTP